MTPAIALSSWTCKYPDDLVTVARQNGFRAVEWDLNYIPLPLSQARVRDLFEKFSDNEISVRFHLPYSSWELGHSSAVVRQNSLTCLKHNIDLIAATIGNYAVLHFGSTSAGDTPIQDELREFLNHARHAGIRIGIENILQGPTSSEHYLLHLTHENSCEIALDVGHGRSQRTDAEFNEFVCVLGGLVSHVHIYSHEGLDRGHYAFQDTDHLARTASLIQSFCNPTWWTCEMDDLSECIRQRNSLQELLTRQ